MSDILIAPECQPLFWAIGLFIYAVMAACLAIACGAVVSAIAYLLFRKSRRKETRLLLPCSMALLTTYVVFVGLFSFVCLWFSGVFSTPDERLFTPSKPVSEEDIVGTWTLDSASLELMEGEGGYEISTHTLTFSDDGTFELVNMPDWCGPAGPESGGFYSSRGTWELWEYSGECGIFVHFASVPEFPDGVYTQFNIGGKEAPYYIWMWAGDPDAGRVMAFEKQEGGP